MKVKRLEEYDKNQLVSSYAIPDIFNLIWILIRYGKTRIEIIVANCVSYYSYRKGCKKYSIETMRRKWKL